jgi:hypothetical protein
MGEDCQESRHKIFRKYRLHHSRLSSRPKGNLDIFHRSLETSDPLLSSCRLTTEPKRKKRSLDLIKDLLRSDTAVPVDTRRELFPDVDEDDDPFHEYFDYEIPVEDEVVILTEPEPEETPMEEEVMILDHPGQAEDRLNSAAY